MNPTQANVGIELEGRANWSHVDSVHMFPHATAGALDDLIDQTTVEAELEQENVQRHAEVQAELDRLLAPRTLAVADVSELAVGALDSTSADLLVRRIFSLLDLPGTNAAALAIGRMAFCAEEEGYPPHYFTLPTASGTIDGTQALPVEILSTIFTLLRESIGGDAVALAALSRVCSRWRGVCLGTASLWSGTLYFPRMHPQLMETVFNRSIARPLSVTVDLLGISYHSPTPRPPTPRVSSIADCAQQWRTRMIRVPPPPPECPFHVLTHVQERLERLVLNVRPADIIIDDADDPNFAQLTSLTLFIMDFEGTAVEETRIMDPDGQGPPVPLDRMMDFFKNSPVLEAFTLTAYALYSFRLQPVEFPWYQLTSLSIFIEMSGDHLYDILIQCTELQECRLAHIKNYEFQQNHHEMPTLTSLEFTTAEDTAAVILEVFEFPHLQSLAFTAHDDVQFCPVDEIVCCAPQGLLSLDLSTCSIGGLQAFTRLLQHVPNLEELTLTDCSTAETFPFLEMFYESALHPLRNLAKLKIGHFSDVVDGRCLVRMIDSLWSHRSMAQAPFPSIRTIELDLNGSPFPDTVETYLGKMSARGFLCLSGVRN